MTSSQVAEEAWKRAASFLRVVDADTYCDTWASWAAPLVSATGWRVIGYDPGYLFDAGDHTVSLASDDVRRLVDLIRGGQ